MDAPPASVSSERAANVELTPLIDILRCPRCGGVLHDEESLLRCHDCGQTYPIMEGIPQLFMPNEWGDGRLDVTNVVKDFYEQTPFPNYDDLDSRESLRGKARLGVFARLLDEQVPPGAMVLEAGCGTGQLSN